MFVALASFCCCTTLAIMSSSPIRKQPRRSRSEALERERKLTELLQSSLMMMLGDNRKLLLRLESTEKANQDLLEHVEVLEKRTGIASPEGPHWLTVMPYPSCATRHAPTQLVT